MALLTHLALDSPLGPLRDRRASARYRERAR